MKLILIINKQNCRIWGTENPHAYIEMPTHPKGVTLVTLSSCLIWQVISFILPANEYGWVYALTTLR